MSILALYAITLVSFLLADAIGLRFLVKPVFDQYIAHLYAEPLRYVPAGLFYLGYVAGILWFVSLPALRAGDPMAALLGGFLLGLMAYGTYEFTNYATLRDWTLHQVAVDTLWGGVLTGFSAWLGVTAMRAWG
ncbi:DUF2177 family protein [Abyssibius alkaniclasticus]|uniref:DUF2177 family protein n=1 Tax=Abyssibius alkaniclasticus TaxID=2881234 RepID=UPI004059E136